MLSKRLDSLLAGSDAVKGAERDTGVGNGAEDRDETDDDRRREDDERGGDRA